jgi:hypothetical protein
MLGRHLLLAGSEGVVGGRIYFPGGASSQGLDTTAVHEVFTPPPGKSCE